MFSHEVNSKIGLTGQILIHTNVVLNYFINNSNKIRECVDELCIGVSSCFYKKLSQSVNLDHYALKTVIIEPDIYIEGEKNYEYSFSLLNKCSTYMWRCTLSNNIDDIANYFKTIYHAIYYENSSIYNIVQKGYDVERCSFTEFWLWRSDTNYCFNGITMANNKRELVKPKILDTEQHKKSYNLKYTTNNIFNNTVYCVMGMHRSGISKITEKLGMAGIEMGDRLIGADTDKLVHNFRGRCENFDEISINNKILSQNSNYDQNLNWMYGNLKKIRNKEKNNDNIINFVRQLDSNNSWALADPRLVLTFPYWYEQIKNIKIVVIIRNPLSVANSLHIRDGLLLSEGINLWIKYYKILIHIIESYSIDYLFVDYDLITIKEKEIDCKISHFLNLPHKNITCNYSINQKTYINNDLLKPYCNSFKQKEIEEIYKYFSDDKVVLNVNVQKIILIKVTDHKHFGVKIVQKENNHSIKSKLLKIKYDELRDYIKENSIDQVLFLFNDSDKLEELIVKNIKYKSNNIYEYKDVKLRLKERIINETQIKYSTEYGLSLQETLIRVAIQIPASFYVKQDIVHPRLMLFFKHTIESYGLSIQTINIDSKIENGSNLLSKIDEYNYSLRYLLITNNYPISHDTIESLLSQADYNQYVTCADLKKNLVKHLKFIETEEYDLLILEYIHSTFIKHILSEKNFYKKFLGDKIYIFLSRLHFQKCLSDDEEVKKINKNYEDLTNLIKTNENKDVVIMGCGKSLLDIDDNKLLTFCKDKVVIGVNQSFLRYMPDIIISSYITTVIMAKEKIKNSKTKIIHCKKLITDSGIENTLAVQRCLYDGELNKTLDIIPILKTQNNIALMASSLAIIFNPKKIYYLGVDLDEQPHFYELDDYYYNAQCALEQSPRFKANSNLAGIDHEYDNYFVTTNLMTHLYESKQKTTEENSIPKRHNTKTPFIVNGVLEAFNNIYKKYYDDNKIEYYVLTKNSRLSEIGFNYHEL